MKKYIMFIIAAVMLVTLLSAEEHEKKPAKLNGLFTWEEWQKQADWEDYFAPAYVVDADKLAKFTSLVTGRNIRFVVFAGDWCGDSKTEVPKIFKIFQLSGIDSKNITLVAVDRNKRDTTGTAERFKVEKVPTLVIQFPGAELGRITEFPQKDWLDDMIEILGKK